jgi:hypothetical protein
MVDHCRFDQVPGAIELMQVPKILKPVAGTPGQNMAIYIAVRLLGALEAYNDVIDQLF